MDLNRSVYILLDRSQFSDDALPILMDNIYDLDNVSPIQIIFEKKNLVSQFHFIIKNSLTT